MTPAKAQQKKLGHRTVVARRKRAAMRARILQATMKVCSHQGNRVPKVDDIVETAGISKGGFYRYFSSAGDALEKLGKECADEFSQTILPVYNVLDDPLKRACVGTMLVLRRAVHDPEWAGYLIRADLTDHESRLLRFIETDLRRGMEIGQFQGSDAIAMSELILGINHTAIRVILRRKISDPDEYIRNAVRFLLRAMGAADPAIEDVLIWSSGYFRSIEATGKW